MLSAPVIGLQWAPDTLSPRARNALPPRPEFGPEEFAPLPRDEVGRSALSAIDLSHGGHIRLQHVRCIRKFSHD
jgi:hypothetical protein